MATANVINMTVKYANGSVESIIATADDTNGNNYLGADGLAPIRMSGAKGNCAIVDMSIAPAPTSTRTGTIRVNGKLIPETVLFGANLGANVLRQFQQAPLRLPQGATITVTQVT